VSQNRYVFPGIGLGAILSQATRVTDNMIYASGAALPELLTSEEVGMGLLYPAVNRIRHVSVRVARGVIRAAQQDGVDSATNLKEMDDETLDQWIIGKMYDPFKQLE
jgi:malate dehydrogenase (oxaloacetate-decarboxylating)(NADP+)